MSVLSVINIGSFKGFGSWVSGIKDVWIILVLINNKKINFKKKSVFQF
jgi:hypothetical protein